MAKTLTRLSLAAGAFALLSVTAQAGQCPADKVTDDGQKPGATANTAAFHVSATSMSKRSYSQPPTRPRRPNR